MADSSETKRDWETIQEDVHESKTQRLKITGGRLYRTVLVLADGTASAVALVYVPD